MKNKFIKVLTIVLSAATATSNSLPAFAYEVDEYDNSVESTQYQNTTDENFENVTNVFAQLGSQYKVTIPKTVILSGATKAAKYFVKVEGDIAGYENIMVVPDEKVVLHSVKKDDQSASILQSKTIWQIDNFNEDANGSIYAENITAGKWQGNFNFNLSLTTEKVAGDIIIPEDQWSDTEMDINFKLGESRIIKTSDDATLTSSNEDVISIDGNKINALKVGKSKVTVSNNNEDKQILNITVNKSVNDVHIHTRSDVIKENEINPTCLQDGSYTETVYCITCNEVLERNTRTIKAKGHNYDKGVITKDSTCTEEGIKTYTCTICGNTYTEVIPVKEHIPGEFEIDKNATCIKDGTKVQKCTVCGSVLNIENIDATGHKPKEIVIENKLDATCEKDGSYEEVVYCKVCGEELSRITKIVPKLGHKEGEVVNENKINPTCTTKGSVENVVYCQTCNKELSRTKTEINALGHDWKLISSTPATCDLPSQEIYECSRCDMSDVKHNTKATGHIVDTIKDKVIAPTCTSQGYTVHTCKNCGKTYSDTFKDSLGHNYVNGKCTRCGDFDISKLEPGLYNVSGTGENKTYTLYSDWNDLLNNKQWISVDSNGLFKVTGINAVTGASVHRNDIGERFLVLDSSVKSLDGSSFHQILISGLFIPSSLEKFDLSYGMSKLNDIYVDKDNKYYTIKDGILYNKSLTKIYAAPRNGSGSLKIPNTVTSIGHYAFFGTKYSTINFNDNIQYIEGGAFRAMPNLSGIINLPKDLKSISGDSFIESGVTHFNIDDNNTKYISVDGIIYTKDLKTLVTCPRDKSGDINIIDGTTRICSTAFYFCRNLTKIQIPDSVTTIESYTFTQCNKAVINIPKNLARIPSYAFEGCLIGKRVVIPKSVTFIDRFNFNACAEVVFEDTTHQWVMSLTPGGVSSTYAASGKFTPSDPVQNATYFQKAQYYQWFRQ